jgi:hypothetical protein
MKHPPLSWLRVWRREEMWTWWTTIRTHRKKKIKSPVWLPHQKQWKIRVADVSEEITQEKMHEERILGIISQSTEGQACLINSSTLGKVLRAKHPDLLPCLCCLPVEWPSQPSLPRSLPVLAPKVFHPRKPLSCRETRKVGCPTF